MDFDSFSRGDLHEHVGPDLGAPAAASNLDLPAPVFGKDPFRPASGPEPTGYPDRGIRSTSHRRVDEPVLVGEGILDAEPCGLALIGLELDVLDRFGIALNDDIDFVGRSRSSLDPDFPGEVGDDKCLPGKREMLGSPGEGRIAGRRLPERQDQRCRNRKDR